MRCLGLAGAAAERSASPQAAELAVSPGGRCAMVYLLGDEPRPRARRSPGCCAGCERRRGRRPGRPGATSGEACVWSDARRASLRARLAVTATAAGASWDVEGSLGSARGADSTDGTIETPALPGRARPASGTRSRSSSTGDLLLSAAAGLRVRRLGRRRPHRRRQSRLAARRRLDRAARVLGLRSRRSRRRRRTCDGQWSITDVARSCSSTSVSTAALG